MELSIGHVLRLEELEVHDDFETAVQGGKKASKVSAAAGV